MTDTEISIFLFITTALFLIILVVGFILYLEHRLSTHWNESTHTHTRNLL